MQISITEDFADERFRQFVRDNFCGGRESIFKSDLDSVTILMLAGCKFSSLQGIGHFTALQELDCSYNELTVLELSQNAELATVNCRSNRLIELNAQPNRLLKELDCSRNHIRTLDLSQNPALEKLECHENMLSKLELSSNRWLKVLNCSYNSLHELRLQDNTALERVDCGSNYIIELDMASCTELTEIRCNHNHLTRLDTSALPALTSLRCFNNHLTSLDLSHNMQLTELYCSENKLTVLDTSLHSQLVQLDVANNLITQPEHRVEGVGIFQYDTTFTCYTAQLQIRGSELAVTAEVPTKTAMSGLTLWIQKVWAGLEGLLDRVLQLIADAHPDEDVNELVLADLTFAEDHSFRIGYDAGDTPAGQLCIYAAFDHESELDPKLSYEMY
ncbi:leucine-rich repeat domain-containing protein [Paenibacillus sp. FSL R7-0204]|uniref:leucine-rich repeat domain-containing protein n=1 Tax=Paenibacillus sp. FSL R7-0204 TaxID=2921675 RepID=UPI0030F5352F